MKRGAPDHWKMRELARLMKVPVRYGVAWANGTMERLWHYTAKYHPQGDIGKAPDWAIAEACGWPAASAKELVDGLVASGWLTADPSHRLLVHDWADHADNAVKKTLKNNGLSFFFPEKFGSSDGKVTPAFPKPLPLPMPMPVAVTDYPKTHAAVAGRFPATDVVFTARIVQGAAQAYVSVDHPKIPEPTDDVYAAAVEEADRARKATSAGFFLKALPNVISNWAMNGRNGAHKSIYRDFDPDAI